MWNSLEIVKLLVAFLTPLSMAGLGWFISRRIKRLELVQWSNQRLIEKRLKLYDDVAPKLNMLLCFFTWVGHWKEASPMDVLKTKRELDQFMHVYRYLFDDNVFQAYQCFASTLFETYQGPGEDAKIRSVVRGLDGDRACHGRAEWKEEWTTLFSVPATVPTHGEVSSAYYLLMERLRDSLGVKS